MRSRRPITTRPSATLSGLAHGLPDHRERLLGHPVVWGDVVGRLHVARVDLLAGHELLDLDGVTRLDLDLVQFLVLDRQKGVLADSIALHLLV